MFDVAFSELVVIGIVALIVIGPERLPRVAKTLGLVIGRFQKMAQHFKEDLMREMPLEEMQEFKAIQTNLKTQSQKITEEITRQNQKLQDEIAQSLETLPKDFCGPPNKKM